MEQTYITITHLDDNLASRFANPGVRLILKKEPTEYDEESITAYSEKGMRYGYVANCSHTVARGTHSAGYIVRDLKAEAACVIRFRLGDTAIAQMIGTDERKGEGDDH